jgi:hypothetical protein
MRKPLLTARIEQVIKHLADLNPRDETSATSRVHFAVYLLRDLLDDLHTRRKSKSRKENDAT